MNWLLSFRQRLISVALLAFLALIGAGPTHAVSQYYCFDLPTSGAAYTWQIWSHDPGVVGRTLYTTSTIAASGPSGNTTAFRTSLIADINAAMPAGWSAVLEFTDDLCPGWDSAMQVNSPDLTPASEFHLSFLNPISCTADGGFCDPDARVRRFVVDSFGVSVPADVIFCLSGVTSGVAYGWGYADTVTANLGLMATPPPAANTIPIRDNFVGALYSVESPPGSMTPFNDYGITAGYEFTTACGVGFWDTAFAVSSDNAPLGLVVTETGGGALIQVPIVGTVAFNPEITQASGVFFPIPFLNTVSAPALQGPVVLGLGILIAALATRRRSRRDP